jgi:PAS domain S-box-containing protein
MVQIEQVRSLFQQATTGLVVTSVVTLILGTFLLTEEASVPTILAWWFATFLVVAWRSWLIRCFRAAKDVDSNPAAWGNRFVAGSALAGLTWGIGGAMLASEVSLLGQILILVVIAGMIAGAIMILGSVLTAFASFMLCAALPLLAWMLWQGDPVYLVISGLAVVYMAGAWVAVLNFSRLLSKAIHLKAKSNTLTDGLRSVNQQLETRDSMLQEAARTASLGHWHFDEVAHEYLSVSDEYARIFGYTVEEFLEKYRTFDEDMKLVFPDDRAKVLASYELGEEVSFDYRIIRKDGQIRHVREISSHTLDENDMLIEARGTLQDITIVKEAQYEAERASHAKSEFLSRMSHELRTPMNAVLGFSQLLDADNSLNEQQKSYVWHILDAGNHLLTLIDEVLDLEQIESGQIQLRMETVYPAEVLQDCVRLIQPLAQKHQIAMENQVTSNDVPAVRADKRRHKQVIHNLMSNGIKYNYTGGRVTVNCEHRRNDRLRISVTDTGPGISEENIGELFEPFTRLGAEISSIEGTGIGLTISQRLARLMGGNIGVKTKEAEGSTFWIDLRLDAPVSGKQPPRDLADAVKYDYP